MKWYYIDLYGDSEEELFNQVALLDLKAVGFPGEGKAHLRVYFSDEVERERVLRKLSGLYEFKLGEEYDRDWVKQVEEGYEPVRSGKFVIIPSNLIPILIKPGMAFGTGYHPSTRIALKLIDSEVGEIRGASVDIGTGSGVLAIALYRKGANPVFAVDNDPLALKEAKENLERNGIREGVYVLGGDLLSPFKVGFKFSLIVANLVLPLFEVSLPEIAEHTLKGGLFIASGISASERESFLRLLEDNSFEVKVVLEEEGWIGTASVLR